MQQNNHIAIAIVLAGALIAASILVTNRYMVLNTGSVALMSVMDTWTSKPLFVSKTHLTNELELSAQPLDPKLTANNIYFDTSKEVEDKLFVEDTLNNPARR